MGVGSSASPRSSRCRQNEIGTKFAPLVSAPTDHSSKYTVHNHGARVRQDGDIHAKPIVGDNGSGMHVHQSVWKDGKNLFSGDGYSGAVRVCAVLHRRRDQAREGAERDHQPGHEFVQALMPGFEAPINLATQRATALRRSACRMCRVEGAADQVQFPDRRAIGLGFSAMHGGLDGVP
jgi:glutamine synthetase